MSAEQAEACRGRCRVIAVNNVGIDTQHSGTKAWIPARAPWADVLYASDQKWWNAYHDRWPKFAGLKVALKPTVWPEVKYLAPSTKVGFDPDPRYLVGGGNSGYAAVHLAVHFGAARVILLGFDMRAEGGAKGQLHYFGNHPPGLANARPAFATWINTFRSLARELPKRGVEVINATPMSALGGIFKRMSLEEALSHDRSRPLATPRELSGAGTPAGLDGQHHARMDEPVRERAGGD